MLTNEATERESTKCLNMGTQWRVRILEQVKMRQNIHTNFDSP